MPQTIPRTIAARYVVDSEVGRGGMAVVYRARDAKGFAHPDWIRNDSDWAALRGNPRFEKLLAGLNK